MLNPYKNDDCINNVSSEVETSRLLLHLKHALGLECYYKNLKNK